MTSHPGAPGIAPGTRGLRVELFDMRLEDVLRGDGAPGIAPDIVDVRAAHAIPGAPDIAPGNDNENGCAMACVCSAQ